MDTPSSAVSSVPLSSECANTEDDGGAGVVSDVDEADIVPPVKKAKVTEEDEVGSKEKAEVK